MAIPSQIIVVPTTQNIELEYPIASVGDRIFARLIDLCIQAGYLTVIYFLRGFDQSQTAQIFLTLPVFFYSLVWEVFFNGQTPGMRLRNLRVIRVDGKPPGIAAFLLRWLLRGIEMNPVLFWGLPAIVAISSSKKGQRIGDMLAGTTVIKLQLVTSFGDTMFVDTDENYEVRFPQIRSLSDKDVAILKDVLDAGLKSNNPELLKKLAKKIKEVANIESRLPTDIFLETILADYNHVFGR